MFGWDLPTEARLLESLGSLFEERPDGVTPFHASLRDWLIKREQSGAAFVVDGARGSRKLVGFLWQRFARLREHQLPDLFTLAELPVQLDHLDRAACQGLLAAHLEFDPIAVRMNDIIDLLEARQAWRSVLAWLAALDRLAEAQGDAELAWRHRVLRRSATAWLTLGQVTQAFAAFDAAVAIAERAMSVAPDDPGRRNDLAGAFINRGIARQDAPGHGPAAAIADYDRAIELMLALRDALGDDRQIPWRNDLANAFMNRGVAKQAAPAHGPAAAIADYDRAIELRQALRDELGDDWPIPWRNDLASAFMNRGVARQVAPGHGPAAAIADYDRAIELMLALRDALGDDWPIPWRNDLANAFMNRGVAKQSAPGHGPAAAIADYDRAIEFMQALRDALGGDWPIRVSKRTRQGLDEPWRRQAVCAEARAGRCDRRLRLRHRAHAGAARRTRRRLASSVAKRPRRAFMNRGIAKQDAPGHGPAAAIADYDRAIELMQALRDALGDDWQIPWRNDLADAFMNRGNAKQSAPAHGPAAAIADYDRAIELRQALRDALGDDWPIPGETTSPTPS